MPAHHKTAYTMHLQPPSIDFEAVAILFEAETTPAVMTFEPGVAGCFSGFDTAEERLKGSSEVADHDLKHMAVERSCAGIGSFVGLDLTKLGYLGERDALVLIRPFSGFEAGIVL